MGKKSSNWLFGIIIAALVVLIAAILFYYNSGNIHLSSVTVTANGQAYSAPNYADLTLYLNSTANSTALAVDELGATAYALNATLSNYTKGNTSSVTTTGYNTYVLPPSYPITNKSRNYTLYEASEDVNVKLSNFSMLEPLLAHISKIGDVSVNYVSAGVSGPKSTILLNEALDNAVANATAQAMTVMGNSSIAYKNITFNSYYVTPLVYSSASEVAAMGSASKSKLIFNGTVTVSRSVSITFYYR
jgi:uncharacterized protein YggE